MRRILQHALLVRDQRDAERLDAAQVTAEAERLGAAVDRLLAGRTTYPPNRWLLDHLARERDALFTFLARPEVQATNWRAEHAIRRAVVCRKAWGGNCTWAGAESWQVLSSLLATARAQQRDPVGLLVPLLHSPKAPWLTLPSPAPPEAPELSQAPDQRRFRVTVTDLIDRTPPGQGSTLPSAARPCPLRAQRRPSGATIAPARCTR